MKRPGIVQRHPELRWLAIIALIVAAGILVSTSVSGVFHEESALPATGPDQLVADLSGPHSGGYYGTIDAQVDLGMPRRVTDALIAATPAGSLLRGSHRLRYWYGDAEHQRVAVITDTSEQDVFRSGNQLWQWDTATQEARRSLLATGPGLALPLTLASAADLAPPQLAQQLVHLVAGSSDKALRSGDPVAGRPTYQLVLTPDTTSSRIGEIDIDIDGHEGVPLRVRIYGTDGGAPVVDVSFEDDVNFAAPSPRNFRFTPPAGATVRSGAATSYSAPLTGAATIGTGWLSVASYHSHLASGRNLARIAKRLLGPSASAVKGKWGKGRLLVTPLVSVLVTNTGQVLAGPVSPSVLYRDVT